MARPTAPSVDMLKLVGSKLQCPICFDGRITQMTWVANDDTYLVMCRCGAILEMLDNGKTNVICGSENKLVVFKK